MDELQKQLMPFIQGAGVNFFMYISNDHDEHDPFGSGKVVLLIYDCPNQSCVTIIIKQSTISATLHMADHSIIHAIANDVLHCILLVVY